jgi:hypothetical protein
MAPPQPVPATNPSPWELDLLWEVPLGGLSFLFSRCLRWTLSNLGRYYNPMNQQETPEWQVVSADFLAKPIKLLWAMSRARWNLHALIAIAGPFNVEESLSIRTATIAEATPSWTAVFYTLGDYQTRTSIGSLTVSGKNEWETVTLPPGRYLVGLRHYHWADPITLPPIQVDGVEALAAKPMAAPPDANRFYRDLKQRQGLIHRCLNGYVYPLLRYRRWLPAGFVRDVFLPVPNPETQFHYGALKRGEALKIEFDPAVVASHDIFFSLYNRFCFPLDWYPLRDATHVTKPLDQKAAFIIRIHPRQPNLSPPAREQVQIAAIAPG